MANMNDDSTFEAMAKDEFLEMSTRQIHMYQKTITHVRALLMDKVAAPREEFRSDGSDVAMRDTINVQVGGIHCE